jgi:hypothetical protein
MFLGLADVHKLCTSNFKPRNIFSVMNIGPEEHTKARDRMPFPVVTAAPDLGVGIQQSWI